MTSPSATSGNTTELTKREYFASLAMQALITSNQLHVNDIPKCSVNIADEILERLK